MFVHYRTQGFILKKVDRGENNQLFTIYTKDFGKLEILGKAIRKIKSKLRGGTDIFYLSDIEFIQGKTHKTLTDAILIEKFENIRKDYNPPTASSQPSAGPLGKLKIAYKIAEIFDELVREQEKDETLWNLLNETFQKLNNCSLPTVHRSLIYYYFLWNLFSILGYQPELYKCSLCQKKLVAGNLYFSPKEGGVICTPCFKKNKQGKKITPETIKIIRIFLKQDWRTLKKINVNSDDLKSLKITSDYFLLFLRESIVGSI